MTAIITRDQIGLREPRRRLYDRMPWVRNHLHHTAGSAGGADAMLAVQRLHLSRGWDDFAYNFGVDLWGHIYEGRGAGVRHGNSDAGFSGTIVWLGNFSIIRPTTAIMESTAWLLAHEFLQGWTLAAPLTGGHRDLAPTQCPGDHAYPLIPEINRRASQIVDEVVRGIPSQEETMVPGFATSAWDWAKRRGIITAKANPAEERPNDAPTRAEVITMIHRALTNEGEIPGWATNYYNNAAAKGIINEPAPEAPISEARALAIATRVAEDILDR